MPWSSQFLNAFEAALAKPFTLKCSSIAEAKRRQAQFLAFRREFRQLHAQDEKKITRINAIVVKVEGAKVILLTYQSLRDKIAREIEAQLAKK